LKPARKLKFPVHEMAIMTSIAVRFIPTIIEEAQRLRKAQMARGAKFEGSLVQRVRSLVPMILPLFFSTLKRAEELAIAMEARCYDSRARRTSFNELAWKKRESLVITGTLVLVLVFKLSAI
ncbi:MAG: energy-coupling factor transporter transmembrane protein EcfT, partial [Calditrichaeota bacterium]